ncbi:hypothetical protein H9M94_03505 [Mycoplasma sp. Pen4]|uniref:hypothetical protein n=1 Tax=Mycoplasma sp. Pen4 TaxID=640330 RepID=UPI0016542592|nr:hypothetical protein [Mycoplasma sp. Pen4]QNM93633.1 hypothetical protein H9M94_03505 [Mycoplasma sp. Pen4]
MNNKIYRKIQTLFASTITLFLLGIISVISAWFISDIDNPSTEKMMEFDDFLDAFVINIQYWTKIIAQDKQMFTTAFYVTYVLCIMFWTIITAIIFNNIRFMVQIFLTFFDKITTPTIGGRIVLIFAFFNGAFIGGLIVLFAKRKFLTPDPYSLNEID